MILRLFNLLLIIAMLVLSGCGPEKLSNDLNTNDKSTTTFSEGLEPNVFTSFNPVVKTPQIDDTAYIHPTSSVIGDVEVGKKVLVGPSASIRGDEGGPIKIGDGSNVQDGVVIHALQTQKNGVVLKTNMVEKDGKSYAVYIGNNVSLAHQSQVHGPALIEDDVFVGMQAFVFKAKVGKGCVLEPGCKVIGVSVPARRYVSVGKVITTQKEADQLPDVTPNYQFYNLNSEVVEINQELANGYKQSSE